MTKLKLKIVDSAFAHCEYSNNPLPITSISEYVEWDRNVQEEEDLVFYTDGNIYNYKQGHKKKIAWLIEPYCYQAQTYEWLLQNNKTFTYVLTNEKKLLDKGENFIYFPFGGCWIDVEDRKVDHMKTKLVSIVASSKKLTPDHLKRHEIIEQHGNVIEVLGGGYQPIGKMREGLVDYMFTFAMENQARDYHFTEKLINTIMVGTIPIYFGCDSIGNYFDTRGMILFSEVSEVGLILKSLSSSLYKEMLPYARENFKLAQQYILSEDWMYRNIFKTLEII